MFVSPGDRAGRLRVRQTAFRVGLGGVAQTGMSTGAYTQVRFNTITLRIGNPNFNTTNFQWRPPVGPVIMSGAVFWTANAINGGTFVAKIIKNGTDAIGTGGSDVTAGVGTAVSGLSGFAIAQVIGEDWCDGNDAYGLYAFGVSINAPSNDLQVDGNNSHTWFQGMSFNGPMQ